MIRELYELGEKYFKDSNPAVEIYPVKLEIPLDSNGAWLGKVYDLADYSTKKTKLKKMMCPYLNINTLSGGDGASFLSDSIDRVFGTKVDPTKVHGGESYLNFIKLIEDAIKELPEKDVQLLEAMLKCLRNKSQMESIYAEILKVKAIKNTLRVVFSINGVYPTESTSVYDYWKKILESKFKEKVEEKKRKEKVSLLTGKIGVPVLTFSTVSGIPDADNSPLVSFDKAAFESYGMKKAENCAVLVEEEYLIRKAAQYVINEGTVIGGRVSRKMYISWTKNNIGFNPVDIINDGDDTLSIFDPVPSDNSALPPSNQEVNALLKSTIEGDPSLSSIINTDTFYLAALRGNKKRIIKDIWYESTIGVIKTNMSNWFNNMALFDIGARYVRKNFRVYELVSSLLPRGFDGKTIWEREDSYPHVRSDMINASITGKKLPSYILPTLLANIRSSIVNGESIVNNMGQYVFLKLILNHNKKLNIMETLNENETNVYYLVGTLMAECENLHTSAMKNVKSSFVTDSLARCSTQIHNISTIMNKINSGGYYEKLNRQKEGRGYFAENEISNIYSKISTLPTRKISSLEDQAMFWLGFYHKKADIQERIKLAAEKKREKELEKISG